MELYGCKPTTLSGPSMSQVSSLVHFRSPLPPVDRGFLNMRPFEFQLHQWHQPEHHVVVGLGCLLFEGTNGHGTCRNRRWYGKSRIKTCSQYQLTSSYHWLANYLSLKGKRLPEKVHLGESPHGSHTRIWPCNGVLAS